MTDLEPLNYAAKLCCQIFLSKLEIDFTLSQSCPQIGIYSTYEAPQLVVEIFVHAVPIWILCSFF